MNWWTIPAIVGGAVVGLAVALVVAVALGVQRPAGEERPGGGPRWSSDDGSGERRYSNDNRLSWNPAAMGVAVIGLVAIAGLAVGLALA